jgi:hypothetical protein
MGLRDSAIVAYAETKVMEKSDRNVWVLSGEILEELIDKTGIDKNEIDGLVMAGLTGTGAANPFWAQTTADVLGLEVGFCEQVHTGGCSAAGCVARAAAAIDYGMCEVAFLLFGRDEGNVAARHRLNRTGRQRAAWADEKGIAVGIRGCDRLGADAAAGAAAAVLHHNGLAQHGAEPVRDDARHVVGRPAGRERHYHLDWMVRIALRLGLRLALILRVREAARVERTSAAQQCCKESSHGSGRLPCRSGNAGPLFYTALRPAGGQKAAVWMRRRAPGRTRGNLAFPVSAHGHPHLFPAAPPLSHLMILHKLS